MRRISRVVTVLPATLALWCAAPVSARATEPIRVGLKILGDTPVTAPLRSCLASTLSHHPGYEVVDQLPTHELDVVANTDVDDNVNRQGVSLAIAYVEHRNAITLAKKLLGGAQPSTDPDVRAAVIALFAAGGSLQRLNVAHIGRPNAQAVATACDGIAAAFFVSVASAN